ncbi:hypothetical protein STXM2123_5761 [Streptomyces sp. F-3]|nr:hypothetical protein STXM2123_5761 [Streptomyces sp. F-3]
MFGCFVRVASGIVHAGNSVVQTAWVGAARRGRLMVATTRARAVGVGATRG